MSDFNKHLEFFFSEKKKNLEDFFDFLRFKSIATDPLYKDDVLKCAQWVAQYLKNSGLTVETWETGNAPVIFGYDLRAGPQYPTLLIYCHYDVQPVDPLSEWTTPPFEPEIRNGEVYARGACDNKGQCFYTMLAIKNLLRKNAPLPVNLKFLVEGEEESGSYGLSKIIESNTAKLKADHLLIVDCGVDNLENPAITLGARGIICSQVTIREANFDLHSGQLGGLAYNPNRALAKLLAQLHDSSGKVAIPGFYDDVMEISADEKKEISFDFDLEHFQKMFGFKPSAMEIGVSYHEANWLRPTLEINGISGGYTGTGFKTVIPAMAFAKISCRLVPNQDPQKIANQLKNFLIEHSPDHLSVDVELYHGSGKGFRTHPKACIVQIMSESYSQVFNKPCKKTLAGGSIPIAAQLRDAAQAEMALVGLGLPDDHIHAPNEHFGLDRIEKGYLTISRAIELFA
jgi:acetylornithine deacetylase/succinyl-diaminopimelate desuccinylase-like protein